MMETYLAIITTILVITQVIRVVQNHIQLSKLGIEYHELQKGLEVQRKAFRYVVQYFEAYFDEEEDFDKENEDD